MKPEQMCGGIKKETMFSTFEAAQRGEKIYGVIKVAACSERNRCRNEDSEEGQSYNGPRSGKQCGGAVNPQSRAD